MKKVLLIGAGNMARPVLLSVLRAPGVKPEDVYVVTGSSDGKNPAATARFLHENGIDGITHLYEKNLPESAELTQAYIVIYAAKPQKLSEILPRYAPLMQPGRTLFLTIAAGKTFADYRRAGVSQGVGIVRIMPHLPGVLYGLFAEQAGREQEVQVLLSGIGAPVPLHTEEEMHAYSAHAGSGPAFIAHALAKGQEDVNFYNRWREVAQRDLGDQAEFILSETRRGTLDYLRRTGLPPLEFAAQVRSPQGMTDAGLKVLETSENLPTAIAEALEACKQRSRGISSV